MLDWLVDLLGLPAALQDGDRPRRRRDPDERVGLHAPRARRRARAGAGAPRRPARRLRVLAGALLGRARREARGLRARAQARRRRRLRAAARGAARARSSRTAPTACIPRSSRARSARPAPAPSTRSRPSPTSPASTASGTTSTPPGPARRCSARSTATSQRGAERADSYTFNPHKWLFTNFDCNVLWVADRAPLIDTLSISRPYLRNAASESGEVIDYRDWHISLGRRFRALKLWWVLRSYGAQGLRALLREHVALAQELGRRIDEHASSSASRPSRSRSSASGTRTATRRRTRSRGRSTRSRACSSRRRASATPASCASRSARPARRADDVERLWRVDRGRGLAVAPSAAAGAARRPATSGARRRCSSGGALQDPQLGDATALAVHETFRRAPPRPAGDGRSVAAAVSRRDAASAARLPDRACARVHTGASTWVRDLNRQARRCASKKRRIRPQACSADGPW